MELTCCEFQPSLAAQSCSAASGSSTPSCQLRLKARVDLGDQTAEFIPFEVISIAILTYFYLLLGINVRFWLARSTHAFNRMRQDGVDARYAPFHVTIPITVGDRQNGIQP